mmetsp:Transcript_48339/g.90494  ORF Transcript_48339/g.90494 Transcript_48339/m.90494 type:complete len:291 (+) Transcript_48339:77-949(+)
MTFFRLAALVQLVWAIREDVDEHTLDLKAAPRASPAAFVEVSARTSAYEEANRAHGRTARSGKGRHHAPTQVHHRRHHPKRVYRDEADPEEDSAVDDSQNGATEPDDRDTVETHVASRYFEDQEEADGDGQEIAEDDHLDERVRHSKHGTPRLTISDMAKATERHPPGVHKPLDQTLPVADATSNASAKSSNGTVSHVFQGSVAGYDTRRSFFVTCFGWALLLSIAAVIALWFKRPELAEKGMCLVTRRLSSLGPSWGKHVEKQEAAVQAGGPEEMHADMPAESESNEAA